MYPTLKPDQHLIVAHDIKSTSTHCRGEILVMLDPNQPNNTLVKRVIGLPGDNLMMQDGSLYLNGKHMTEPYLNGTPSAPGSVYCEWTLKSNEYVVLGDNRSHSTDSRQFGPIPFESIVGKVWLRYWPPNQLGHVNSKHQPLTESNLAKSLE
jgi:signal peptidase I